MIQRLYVHNYRCLENFELPIKGLSSALLIGKNGSGKSTIGQVLELFQSIGRGVNKVNDLVKPSDFNRGRSEVPIRFEIEVMIQEQVYAYVLALELPVGFKELRVYEEKLTVSGNVIYSRLIAEVNYNRPRNKPTTFSVDWHVLALTLIQENSDTDPLSIFKMWLRSMLILSPIPSLIKGDSEGSTFFPKKDLTNLGEWMTGVIAKSPKTYSLIETYLKQVMPDFEEMNNEVIRGEFRSLSVRFKQDQADLTLPASQLSDGEKCFLICSLVLAANKAYGPIFCFWDEPDNYLSLTEVGHFVTSLRKAFKDNGQLLITSHNPEAIRKFSDETTLLLYRASHFEPTQIRPLSELQIEGDLIGAIIRDEIEPAA